MVDGLEGFGDFHFSIALFYLNVTITCNLHAHIQHQGLSNMSVAGNPSVADDPSGATVARSKKSLKNLFLEKIIIPAQKSIPFNVIKEVK